MASLSVRRYRFLGAKKLEDGGFSSKGVVAPVIALDRDHPKRFLAESRLEAMLMDEHIENVEDLTVSWGPKIFWWNLMLVLCTMIFSILGLLPYLTIILESQHPSGKPFLPSGWGFPILRVLGSALCVNASQFVMQLRVLVILKTRLLFITIDRLAKEKNIDISSNLNTEKEREHEHPWSPDVASEPCIWALERWILSSVTPDPEPNGEKNTIRPFYESEYRRHFNKMKRTIPRWLHPILCFVLVIGTIMTIAGYIGCFYLIQRSPNTSFAPAVWLLSEALLSVVRIIIWMLNPSWDDSKGVIFELELASHAPLISCNRFQKDIEHDCAAPVARSNNFLEEIVAYQGPLPVFGWSDVTLYYIFTAKDQSPPIVDYTTKSLPQGILYIVLFDYKEQTSRMIVKKENNFLIFICSLEFAPGNTAITVKVDLSDNGITESKTHSFTANTKFMKELTSHYDDIASLLQKKSKSNNLFGKTWALSRPEGKKEGPGNAEASDDVQNLLTDEDNMYLRQGQLERRWKVLFRRLEEWTEINIALYMKELLQDLAFKVDESVTLVQKNEANEVEFLFIEYRIVMEQLLMSTTKKWDDFVETHHKNMVETVLKGTFGDDAEQHGVYIRRAKLKSRLVDEWKALVDTESRNKERNRSQRIDSQTISTDKRLQRRRYYDPTGEAILEAWKELPKRLAILGPFPLPRDDPSSSPGFKKEMEDRFQKGDSDISNMLTEGSEALKAKKDVIADFESMKKRCQGRFDLFVSRMKQQRDEFVELSMNIQLSSTLNESNILTAESHNEAVYWSTSSIQERHRLMDRNQRYLALTNESISTVGGPKNMVRVLKRSQNFAFIDFCQTKQLSGSDALQIVKDVNSITGICWTGDKAQEISEAIMSNFTTCYEKEGFACLYQNVNVTDYYRKGRPYLMFKKPGHSICTLRFRPHQERDHIISINHCMTTSRAVVDITLNGQALERTWGLPTSRATDDFHQEDILLPRLLLIMSSHNELSIKLVDSSPGNYCMSDIIFSVVPNP